MTHTFDAIEKNTFEQKAVDIGERMRSLHSSFQKSLSPEGKTFSGPENLSFDRSITDSFGLRGVEITPEVRAGAVRTVKDMYYGKEVNGSNSLGLKKISSWKISPENRKANLNQHAGFAAEVISTAKENYISEAKHTGDMTYRADDIPAGLRDKLSEKGVNIARKNDPFIDKVRVRADGTIETVQTKFVGKDADSCLSRLMSKRFEKYLDNPAVHKIEVPKEYYDDLKTSISVKKKELCKQYGVVSTAAEKTLDAAKIKHNITKLDTLRDKIEPSVVISGEAKFAAGEPKMYTAVQMDRDLLMTEDVIGKYAETVIGTSVLDTLVRDGLTDELIENAFIGIIGAFDAPVGIIKDTIDFGVDSYRDIKSFTNGEISKTELADRLVDNTKNYLTKVDGGLIKTFDGLGDWFDKFDFVLEFVADASEQPIIQGASKVVSKINVARAIAAFGKETYEDIEKFKNNEISGGELVYNLGENTAGLIGDLTPIGKEKAQEIYRDAVETVDELKDAAVEKAVEVGEDIKEFAVDTADYIADGAVKVGKGIQKGAKKAKAAVVKKVKGIFD